MEMMGVSRNGRRGTDGRGGARLGWERLVWMGSVRNGGACNETAGVERSGGNGNGSRRQERQGWDGNV